MIDSISGLGPYIFTYFGVKLFMLAATFLLLPILYFLIIKSIWSKTTSRLIAALICWSAFWLIAYGDVLYIAWQAKQLCRAEAGRHVYRTASVDGFLGGADIQVWSTYGFSYVEYLGRTYVRVVLEYGKPVDQVIAAPTSQYEFA